MLRNQTGRTADRFASSIGMIQQRERSILSVQDKPVEAVTETTVTTVTTVQVEGKWS